MIDRIVLSVPSFFKPRFGVHARPHYGNQEHSTEESDNRSALQLDLKWRHAVRSLVRVSLFAEELIERRTGRFEPDSFKDSYIEALRHLVEKKIKVGGKAVAAVQEKPERKGAEITDLQQALKRSLSDSKEIASRRVLSARRKPEQKLAPKRNARRRES